MIKIGNWRIERQKEKATGALRDKKDKVTGVLRDRKTR